MPSRELNKKQIAALGLAEAVRHKEILTGLVEIAAYTGQSVTSLRRAIKRGALVAGNGGTRNGKYITTKQNIDIYIGTTHLKLVREYPATKKQETIRSKLYEHIANKQRNT